MPQLVQNFDLSIQREGSRYRARVASPGGEVSEPFELDVLELEQYRSDQKALGTKLFEAVFHGKIANCYGKSIGIAQDRGERLIFRIRLAEVPELSQLPWECLYDPDVDKFLSLSTQTPIVRYFELPQTVRALRVRPPLRMLVVICSPSDRPKLDHESEWRKVRSALGGLRERGIIELHRLEDGTFASLKRELLRTDYHILHFVGHGEFKANAGVLLFEDEKTGTSRPITGSELARSLEAEPVRLAILNACDGAVSSPENPFSGVAQELVQLGIPAVISMQSRISDSAAIAFTSRLHEALWSGQPIDTAVTEARMAMMDTADGSEWTRPVLFLRAVGGVFIEVEDRVAWHTRALSFVLAFFWANLIRRVFSSLLVITVLGVVLWSAQKHAHAVDSGVQELEGRRTLWPSLLYGASRSERPGGPIGFTYELYKPATIQVFVTAQALVALFHKPTQSQDKPKIKSLLLYMEANHQKGYREPGGQWVNDPGWSYFGFERAPTISEVSAWVALAKIRVAQENTGILTNQERDQLVESIRRDLDELKDRANRIDGGWSVLRVAPVEVRTYSTLMALWAFVEARKSPEVLNRIPTFDADYGQTIRDGLNWLIRHHDPTVGWVPNPSRPEQSITVPGLEAQALFVLNNAALQYDYLRTDPGYLTIREQFLERFANFNTKDSASWFTSLSDQDQYVHYDDPANTRQSISIEGMRFFSYSWILADVAYLAKDEGLNTRYRQFAKSKRSAMLLIADDAVKEAESCCTYELAENLIGISYALEMIKN